MRIKVFLFAGLRDRVGKGELEVEFEGAVTVSEVWDWLATTYPSAEPYAKMVLVAINEVYCQPWDKVADGDEVAFIPPISGGDWFSEW